MSRTGGLSMPGLLGEQVNAERLLAEFLLAIRHGGDYCGQFLEM
jgi:hypothetical protein